MTQRLEREGRRRPPRVNIFASDIEFLILPPSVCKEGALLQKTSCRVRRDGFPQICRRFLTYNRGVRVPGPRFVKQSQGSSSSSSSNRANGHTTRAVDQQPIIHTDLASRLPSAAVVSDKINSSHTCVRAYENRGHELSTTHQRTQDDDITNVLAVQS